MAYESIGYLFMVMAIYCDALKQTWQILNTLEGDTGVDSSLLSPSHVLFYFCFYY